MKLAEIELGDLAGVLTLGIVGLLFWKLILVGMI